MQLSCLLPPSMLRASAREPPRALLLSDSLASLEGGQVPDDDTRELSRSWLSRRARLSRSRPLLENGRLQQVEGRR